MQSAGILKSQIRNILCNPLSWHTIITGLDYRNERRLSMSEVVLRGREH
jgi:hypothetical protein